MILSRCKRLITHRTCRIRTVFIENYSIGISGECGLYRVCSRLIGSIIVPR